ncbi:transporter [Microvirga sp. VF16]|uniref:SphA family protein n=1 Tax=Microvirga sp. VF16 TaxID=2807101 RepID=UPI00193EAE10|nr:transporter [Microvirga sp. VF16]QRM31283.1 transporter [Microvirga sp. VF16]
MPSDPTPQTTAAPGPAGSIRSARPFRFVALGFLSLLGGLGWGSAQATEGGASLFIPGGHGPGAGIVPPPGFYFANDFFAYSGELTGGRQIQIGGAVLADVKTEVRADFLTATWITPLEILGGRVGFGLSLPFGVPRVSAGILIEAPRLGRTFAFSQRDASFVLGDPLVAGLIGWDAGKFHWSIGATVNIPAGGYEEGELSNLAFNRWIGDVYAALTWLDPELGLDLSGAVGFEFNGENPETDYRSGNAFHFDVSISKHLTKEFSVGLLAGYYDQVSDDGGAGNRIGPFKGRVTAVGATAGYDFTVAGTPVSTRIKVLREVDVENRPQGTIGLFSLGFPLGGHAPPAAPRAVTAKY